MSPYIISALKAVNLGEGASHLIGKKHNVFFHPWHFFNSLSSMTSTIRIPSVTPGDLQRFRARIFQDVPEPTGSVDNNSHEANYYDGDGLGYYPDGVKRTLTDQQIAMFRHSEIYALLRERQVKKENLEAGFSEQPSTPGYKSNAEVEVQRLLKEDMESDDDNDDEEEYAAFLAAEQQQIQSEATQNKRKRTADHTKDDNGKEPTMRRVAREMDEADADETVLDYGDEPSEAAADARRPSPEDHDELYGRKRVKYEDAEETVPAPATTPAIQGRKIWWPTIGS